MVTQTRSCEYVTRMGSLLGIIPMATIHTGSN